MKILSKKYQNFIKKEDTKTWQIIHHLLKN